MAEYKRRIIDQDVWDDYRRLAIPAIPRGSPVELLVRTARDGNLILDLDSVIVGGQRYAVSARANRIDSGGHADNDGNRAAQFIGGGAIIRWIVGAIAGGGKGAAIGAAAGAAAGTAGLLNARTLRQGSRRLAVDLQARPRPEDRCS